MSSGGEKKNQLLNFDVPFTPRCSDASNRGRLPERGKRVGGHPSLCSQEAEHQGRELHLPLTRLWLLRFKDQKGRD